MCSRTPLVFLATWLAATWLAVPLAAQYTAPGESVSQAGSVEEEQGLRSSLEDARWRLGALRLEPWIGLRDVSAVTSSSAEGSDFTATAGAGVRAYLKTGRRLILAAHVLPEYVWWRDDDAKTSVAGRYGLGLFAYFNRLDLEVSLRRNESQSFFSSEVQELTTTRSDVGRFAFDLEISDRVSLVGNYQRTESANQEEGSDFRLLDQEREATQLGLRYRLPRDWWIGVAVETSANDFAERNLDHTGKAGLFDLGYEGARFTTQLRLELRSLEPRAGSDFVDLETTTGYFETGWEVRRATSLFVYGRRQIGYSIRSENSNFLSGRAGVRLDLGLRGAKLELAAEVGEDDFETIDAAAAGAAAAGAAAADRLDEVVAFGALLSFDLSRLLRVRLGATHTEYDSNLEGFDRDVTAWTATIELKALRDKLGVGDGRKTW